MKNSGMLAIDMGASNGRVIYGSMENGRIHIQEVHRFANEPVMLHGVLYWDFLRLFYEIETGMAAAVRSGLEFDSVGLNSWGNTVGFLDRDGDLLFNPYHYRDENACVILNELNRSMPEDERFLQTLFTPMKIQPTVFLKYIWEHKPLIAGNVDTCLMISDYFNYFLCGVRKSEVTMAATSQMLDLRTMEWNHRYIKALGIDERFPDVIPNGTVLGPLKREIVNRLGLQIIPSVVAVAGHDTAAASGCVPWGGSEDSLYLSCGTWACMGCRVEQATESRALFQSGITNDLGLYGERHLRFNHTGLWIIQECRREWKLQGKAYTWDEICDMAEAAVPFLSVIDTESDMFFQSGCMIEKIKKYCQSTGQKVPETDGEIARIVYEGLAMRYRYSRDNLQRFAGCRFRSLRIMGGGSRNSLLCQFTANALGIPVQAGPAEASVLGNLMQQGIAMGQIASFEEGRQLIARSERSRKYEPQQDEGWERAYQRHRALSGWT